jgi:hypothetical protein
MEMAITLEHRDKIHHLIRILSSLLLLIYIGYTTAYIVHFNTQADRLEKRQILIIQQQQKILENMETKGK